MTREDAIKELQSYAEHSWGDLNDAFKMAISALRQQPHRCPCDLCNFGPPSSMRGKPCTMCPAMPKQGTVSKCNDLFDEDGSDTYHEKESICSSTNLPCCKCNPGPCDHRNEPVANRNGLIVDDIVPSMTLDHAIAHLDDTLSDTGRKWSCESCRLEHVQLRAWLAELRDIQQKRNEPLTLDEIRNMVGEPVWCKELECYGIIKIETIGRFANTPFLIGVYHDFDLGTAVNFEYDIKRRHFSLYRQKPEEWTV